MKAFVNATLLTAGILGVTLAISPASANIYKHVDEYGNVSYSDKPIQGAEEFKVRGSKSKSDATDQDEDNEETSANSEEGEQVKSTKYRSLEILTPRQGKVVDSESKAVQVILLPTPSLGENDELVINIDGKDVSKGRDVNLSVQNLPSGNHTVSSRIQNSEGKVVIESASVSFEISD